MQAVSTGVWCVQGHTGERAAWDPGTGCMGARRRQDTSVCVTSGGDRKRCAIFMTPGTSAPQHLSASVLPSSWGRLPSQPASRDTRFSQREKSQSYSAARGGRQRPVFLLLRSISGSEPGGLRFPGHTWNSHREKGFILLRQWRTGRYHS